MKPESLFFFTVIYCKMHTVYVCKIVLLRFQNFSRRSVLVGFAEKNLGFRFGLGFHDKHVVNFFMTSVHTVSSTKTKYSCKPNANHVTPLYNAKGELATEF